MNASVLAAALAASLLFLQGAHAQGSAADYERSNTLRDAWRDLVVPERLDEVWLSDHQLFHRRPAADGWEPVLVDALTGQRGPAFDVAAVARAMGTALGRELDPERLPIDAVAMSGGRLALLSTHDLRAFTTPVGGTEVRELPLRPGGPFVLEPAEVDRSRDLGGDCDLTFVNRTAEPVELVWLDRSGERRSYGAVDPGARHRQHTFEGHAWLVLDPEELEIARYRAAGAAALVLVEPLGWGDPELAWSVRSGRSAAPTVDLHVVDSNLVLRSSAGGRERPLTADGTPEDPYTDRHWWSPDQTRVVAMRTVPPQEHTVHLVESAPTDRVQPRLHSFDYLKPGDRIARPRPRVFDATRGEAIEVDDALWPEPWSFTRTHWSPDGDELRLLYNQRGHQLLRIVGLDVRTGAARTILEERSATFVDYAQKLELWPLEGRDELVWASERSGWNHLYLVDAAAGEVLRPITSGEWLVRSVESVDSESRTVLFRALGLYADQDPYHVHWGRASLDGGEPVWLTEGDGMHALAFSPSGEWYVDTWSRVDRPPVHELRRASDGALVVELARADASALDAAGWRPPERFAARGRDGTTDIWGVIHRPTTFDPTTSYPVIEQIYAGPHGHFVPKRFQAWHWAQEIAELGFVVVQIDGMGTNWRSKAFHDVAWQNLGDSGFADRIAWMRAAAATRPWMDLERVGIYGGSAGGQSALRAVLAHGDFYDAASADCGCHDNRMDKIWWNELWMGWPVGPHYAQQSNVTNAHRLEGDLLLIVGELDRNVDPASTMQVVDALVRADKDFELLVMPGVGHGAAQTPYARRRQKDFFVRKLLGREPRWTP